MLERQPENDPFANFSKIFSSRVEPKHTTILVTISPLLSAALALLGVSASRAKGLCDLPHRDFSDTPLGTTNKYLIILEKSISYTHQEYFFFCILYT